MPRRDYHNVFEKFRQLKVMVIGDVMVDTYIFGKVERISPEAPVPVVSVEKRVSRLGGAANVALNLMSLGAEPVLCSVIGDDAKGEDFIQLLTEAGINPQGIIKSKNRLTTTKFRVIGNKTQMLRVDEEVIHDLNPADQASLINIIGDFIRSATLSAIIFQDYNKGVLTPDLITRVIEMAKTQGIAVAVDPKKKNFLHYNGAAFFKPNLKELREGLNRDIQINDKTGLQEAAAFLHKELGIKIIMTTLSEQGVFISSISDDGQAVQQILPAHIRNIADVSGAGDTVISVATLGLAAGLDPAEIAALSNLAGGLVCEEVGVVPVDRERLLNEVLNLF
jgi:rfaE bifunctional protein kinase chain/domain